MPWKPGQSGYTEGTKTKKPITDALRVVLTRNSNEELIDNKPMTNAQAIALSLVKKAREGDTIAQRELIDRIEGKAVQPVEVGKADPFDNLSTDDLIALGHALDLRLASLADKAETSLIGQEIRTLPAISQTKVLS